MAGLRTTIKKINGDTLSPVVIFKRLQGSYKFLLESAILHEGTGRYSFIGANPRKSYIGQATTVTEIEFATGKTFEHHGELFTLLKRLMPRVVVESEFPFVGGAVGYVGSNVTQLDTLHDDGLALPDLQFNIYDTIIVYDHVLQDATVLHTNIHPEQSEVNLDEIIQQIQQGEVQAADYELSTFISNYSSPEFEALANEAQQALSDNDCTQIVVSRRLQATFAGDTFELYRTLRKQEASPFMYYIEFDDYVMMGASPAGLVKVEHGKVQASPVAGTMLRGHNMAEDIEVEKDLQENIVELKKHQLLIEESTKDIENVCVRDSVKGIDFFRAIRLPHVQHLVSQLEGTLLPMLHSIDALAVSLPAIATNGVPKSIAANMVLQLEKEHRSFYGGAVGYIGFDGQLDFALTIRSVLIQNGQAYTQVGATILQDSVASQQYEETQHKIASILKLSNEQV